MHLLNEDVESNKNIKVRINGINFSFDNVTCRFEGLRAGSKVLVFTGQGTVS
jgi:hypothetical protein